MNAVFFLVPFLIIAGLGIYQDASAADVTVGYDYFQVRNPDGSYTRTTHEPYVMHNGQYVPFVQNGLSVQTAQTTVTLNNDGSYSFNGKLTDMIVAKYADISNLNSWTYPNTLNNDTPDVTWNDGFVSSKIKTGVGQLDYRYILENGKWKTQLEATNLSALTTKVFGFDQIIDLNSDTIKFGGITRNLDNFNGVTFDKEFLDANKAKMIDLLNGIYFDFDLGYENLYSVTVYDTGANKSRLIFDYRTDEILLPGETLIIDPTFGYTTGTMYRVDSTGTPSASCLNAPYSESAASLVRRSDSDLSSICAVTATFWDMSSLTNLIDISSVNLRYDVDAVSNALNCDVVSIRTINSGSTAQAKFETIVAATTQFVDNSSQCTTVANQKVVSLGSLAIVEFENDINSGDNEIGVGIRYDSMVRDSTASHETSFSDIQLEITYTEITPPDAVTDLSILGIGYTSLSIDWTAPDPGLPNQSILGYQVNVTTPQTSSPLVFLNDTGTTATAYVIEGLLPDTDYSIRVSAWTNRTDGHPLNNATGNVLDVTTAATTSADLINEEISVVGDTARLVGFINVTSGGTSANLTNINILLNGVPVNSNTTIQNSTGTPYGVNIGPFWIRMTTSAIYEFEIETIIQNAVESVTNSTSLFDSREYDPDYAPAVDNPSTQGNVNATLERFDDEDGLLLKVNRIDVSTGDTWQIECIAQTNSEASQTKDETQSWEGDWQNETNTGYFNTTFTGYANSHAYITCFNEDELFTMTSFTNSSLALLGIQLFDESYGSMLGVPVGVFFLVMTAGMANKRTAPTFIIVITGIAGTMATIGFFSFEPLVWGLALVTAMLGIFVNQKIF